MNWNSSSQMELHYSNNNNGGMPYNSIGSFVDFFGGLAYDHVNFIFADTPYAQESMYPSISTNSYKYEYTGHGNFSYYDYDHPYTENNPVIEVDDVYSKPLENNAMNNDEQSAAAQMQRQGNSRSTSHNTPVECPRHHQNNREEVVWQDYIDPDHMTYEELLELGEVVGTQSKGLPEDLISLLPVSKFRRSLFSRKRSRDERCVICQMEYKRGDKRMTLPCKHNYHAGCCRRWLGINKACPICYTEVTIDATKR